MILVAVGLLMGTSAWAGTQILYTQNYESATDASSWRSQHAAGNLTLKTGDATYGNYINFAPGGANSRTAYSYFYTSGSDFYGDYTSYTLEFDVLFTAIGNSQDSQLAILPNGVSSTANASVSSYLFALNWSANSKDLYVNGSSTEKASITTGHWNHIKLDVDGTEGTVAYAITDNSTNTVLVSGNSAIASGVSFKAYGIHFLSGRYYADTSFDNISITTEVAGDVANDPSVIMTGVKGENREYTITFDEGETLHYTVPGGTEQTTTTSPLVLTITEAGTLSAYTTKGTATSSTVEATVTHGAITLNAPVFTIIGMVEAEDGFFYPQVSFSSDNSSLEGAPVATYNVTSPYTFTAKGNLTVTASAEGYNSSSATYATKKYQLSKTIDFGALTADDFDASVWTSATGAPRDYWTNRAAQIPADVTYYKLIDPSLETAGNALAGITISNASIQDPEVYIGYGLLTKYYQGKSGYLNFTVNDATSLDYAVYDGWNNYGNGTFNTIQAGDANFALFRYDTMLRTIKVYSGDYSFGIVGDFTGGWDTDVEMTQSTEDKNVYTLVIDKFTATAATKYEYKLRADGQWGGYQLPDEGNNDYYFENAGVYKLTFTANIKANTLTLAVEENDDYTLVGCFNNDETPSFFGTTWDVNNADNLMTKNEDGTYTKTFNNVYLEAGTILYKVVKNHSFDTNWGFNGNNADYGVGAAGVYDITFTFNPNALLSNGFNLTCDVTAIPSTVAKTISAVGYATYCSPYALDFSSTGLTAYIAKKDDSNKVTFTEVTKVPANTGVLLKGDAGDYTINTTPEATDNVTDNVLVGVTKDTKKDAGIFVLMNGTQGVGFYVTKNEFTVGGNTAYLPALATSRSFIGFDFEDNTTTGISSMHNSQCIMHNEVYNLNGQRVMRSAEGRLQGKNAKKGLYIVNGKKVIK